MNPAPDHQHAAFPATRWTLVERLHSPDEATARRALDDLCTQYHYPLYCYIRRRGFSHHDAQDALHDFLAKLLRTDAFARADASRGRLRAYLATALQHFLRDWRRQQLRQPSMPGLHLPGPDTEARYQREHFTDFDTPETVFDRKWGHELLARILATLADTYTAKGKAELFDTLRPVVLTGGSLRDHDPAALAAALGLKENTLRVALSRLLREFRDHLRLEVLQTVASQAEVDAEISHLMQVFAR